MPKFYVILAIELADVNLEMGALDAAGIGNSVTFVTLREITLVYPLHAFAQYN